MSRKVGLVPGGYKSELFGLFLIRDELRQFVNDQVCIAFVVNFRQIIIVAPANIL